MHGKQLANEVKMACVLYRKCGLCSTHSFWNLSGINALPKTVAWYDSKQGILVQYSVTWWTALINFRTSFINHFTLSCYSRKLFEDWLYHHCKQSWYFDMTQCESYCHWFDCFSFFRSSGVVENYQAKLIRDLLSLGVVQKQTKSPMNGLVLHVKNYLKNQFSTKNTHSIAAKPYFSRRAYGKNIGRSVTQHCVIFQTWHAVAALFKT